MELSVVPSLVKLCYFFFFLFIPLSSFFKINIYRYRLSVCEVSLQEFPVWGPRPLTRLNLPFQMKAALRETVLFGRAAEPCLQTAGMWDVWSGGQEARKECQVCPCLSRAGSPFSSQWRAQRASEYKGSSTLQSELRSTPLPKLNSSFHQENERKGRKKGKTVTGAAEKRYERDKQDKRSTWSEKGFSGSNSETKRKTFSTRLKEKTRIYFHEEEKMSAGMKKTILLPFLCIMLSYMVSQKNNNRDSFFYCSFSL